MTLTIEEIRKQLDSDTFLEDGYLKEADKLLWENGYHFTGAPCDCADEGEFGHDFACGFTRESESH